MYKFEFYVPETHLDTVKKEVFKSGGGKIGTYDCCCWVTEGIGQFRPLKNSDPYLGEMKKVAKVNEFKVEFICAEEYLDDIIITLKNSHPYEVPAYQFWEVNKK
ncbi:MAG: hypothetical protein K9L78_04090 [Victivallales bacterium]|nr:hypothetical protein [Victivallales bacterium]MCF7889282.1 hypothetical protein [Victivallales bacterium]